MCLLSRTRPRDGRATSFWREGGVPGYSGGRHLGYLKALGQTRQEANPPCVSVIDRERAQWGLHFLSPDSPWVWLPCPFKAEGVFAPGPGVRAIPGGGASRGRLTGLFVLLSGGEVVGRPQRLGEVQRGWGWACRTTCWCPVSGLFCDPRRRIPCGPRIGKALGAVTQG